MHTADESILHNFFDFDKMLNQMKEEEAPKASNSFFSYKNQGSYKLRILPPLPKKLPFLKKFVHWVNKEPVLCLNQGPDPIDCPICELAYRAYREDDKTTGSKLRRRERVLFRVLDRTDDSEPKLFEVPKSVYDMLYELMVDEEWNILDPQKGRDITFTKKGEGLHTKYAVKASPKQSPIYEDKERIDVLLDEKLSTLSFVDSLKIPSKEEVAKLLEEQGLSV